MNQLTLISHPLCPYVQRAVIALKEKAVAFERIDIDLSNKPDWFTAISPLGKTPVLKVGDEAIFESAVILEYLEETQSPQLHPSDPLRRAEHRAWIEFSSALLNDIAGLYSASDEAAFQAKRAAIAGKFTILEAHLTPGPYFDGEAFTLVDAVFGPVFRYFDVIQRSVDLALFNDKPKVIVWRKTLSLRPSIAAAVAPDYNECLWRFLAAKPSYLAKAIAQFDAQARA